MDVSPREPLAEEIARRRVVGARGTARLADAATELVPDGLGGPAVAELAGLGRDENPFEVDALLERVVVEVGIAALLDAPAEQLAARSVAREVLAGRLAPRELTAWAHLHGGHDSPIAELAELAELDDEFDIAGTDRARSDAGARVRALAARLTG